MYVCVRNRTKAWVTPRILVSSRGSKMSAVGASIPKAHVLHSRPPSFTLDLLLPPTTRWAGILDIFTIEMLSAWNHIFAWHNRSLFDSLTEDHFLSVERAVAHNFPEHAGELYSIASEFARLNISVTFVYLCAWAYSHELAHTELAVSSRSDGCTALIAEDDAGHIHHVALMDQEPIEIRWVVVHVRFALGEQILCEGSDWYWFTSGLTRMVRKGTASLQENWRWPPTKLLHRDRVLTDITQGVMPQSWIFRSVLSAPALRDFQTLVSHLVEMRMGAPYYVAIGGIRSGEGAIFARAGLGEVGSLAGPGVQRLLASNGTWYLVQTNSDRWNPDPESDCRRTYAERALDEAGRKRGATELGLLGIANIFPIRNPTTSHIAVMNAAAGTINTFVLEPTIVIDVEEYGQIVYASIDPTSFWGEPAKNPWLHAEEDVRKKTRPREQPVNIVLLITVPVFGLACLAPHRRQPVM